MSFLTQLALTVSFFVALAAFTTIAILISNAKSARMDKQIHHDATHGTRYPDIDTCPYCEHEIRHQTRNTPDNCKTCIEESQTRQREKVLGRLGG